MPVILLADPDHRTRAELRHVFSLVGWDTLHAGSDLECVDLAIRHRPDVMVLAVCEPELHGIHIVRALAGIPEFRHMRTVALATQADFLRYRAALESDFDAAVPKGSGATGLICAISALLELEETALATASHG